MCLVLWDHMISIPCYKPLLLRVLSNHWGLVRNAGPKAPCTWIRSSCGTYSEVWESTVTNHQSIIPNHGEGRDHLGNFLFVCFVPMSKAQARLTEIRVPDVEYSVCQINASHKILLCIFEKYGIQFRCRKANYVILLGSSDRTSSKQWQLYNLNMFHVEILPIKGSDCNLLSEAWLQVDWLLGRCCSLKEMCVSVYHYS